MADNPQKNYAKKSLGQNFLINPGIAPKMVAEGGLEPDFGVLEIGPGEGALTAALLESVRKVAAVELDADLLPQLEARFAGAGNFSLIHGDIMKLDLAAILERELPDMPRAVVGNLPYYITTPILMRLLEERLPIKKIIAMVQKEAAVRLTAPEGSRASGAVTLAVRYYAEPRMLFDVSPGSFRPVPKVTSTVIALDVLEHPRVSVGDERMMFAVIRAAFGQRRKTVLNAVAAGMGRPKEEVAAVFGRAGVDAGARAERLTLSDYAVLADIFAAGASGVG